MAQQATHNFRECREPCVQHCRDRRSRSPQPPGMERCCGRCGRGMLRWQRWSPLSLGCSPLPELRQHRGRGQQTCGMRFLLDISCFELGRCPRCRRRWGGGKERQACKLASKGWCEVYGDVYWCCFHYLHQP